MDINQNKSNGNNGEINEKDETENLQLNQLGEEDKKVINGAILKATSIEREEIFKLNELNEFDDDDVFDDIDEFGEDGEIIDSVGGNQKKRRFKLIKSGKISYMPVHIFAFAIPFVLMIIAFSTIKIYPFGSKQIMIIDSWHQYYPFLQELQYKLTHGQSLLYSWNTGGGTNFLTLMAYYASTPLYLLSVLFPRDNLREFMMIITAVKIACSGLFFSIYLRGIYTHDYIRKSKKNTGSKSGDSNGLNNSDNAVFLKTEAKRCSVNIGFVIIGFSILYALSAYAVGYYWCIMFLDGMALLPLIILGLERLIDSGKFKLYIISLGIAVIADFYIAMFICFFILVYYAVLYLMKTPKPSLFGFVMKGLQIAGASLVGIGLAAFILLPTYLWFGNTGNSGSQFNETLNTYNTLLDIITNLLPATTPANRAGLPNIACGLIVVIFAALYFINPRIKTRDKLLSGGFILFMLFSFNLNFLNFLWHGGRYPNEIPYRQAFVVSFILVTIAFRAFIAFKGESITKKNVWILCLCIFGYLILAEQWYGKSSDKFDFKVFYISIILLIIYGAVLLMYKNKKFSANYLSLVLVFIMITEGGLAAVKGAETAGTSDRDSYPPSGETVRKTIGEIYEEDEDLFYRLEMSRWYSTNDPALYGYRGISQFSSEANARFSRTLEVLGLAASVGSNRYLYSNATPVFNALMSIKYLIGRDEEPKYEIDSFVFDEYMHREKLTQETDANGEPVLDMDGNVKTVSSEPVTVYKNKYWLPLGFMMSEDVKETDIDHNNIFVVQNDLWQRATGIYGDVFKSIQPSTPDNYNLTEYPGEYGIYSYRNTDKSQKATVKHYYVSETTQQVYMYIKSGRSKEATVTAGGRDTKYEVNRGITIDCGRIAAGQEISVSFELEAADSGTYNIFVAGFDEELFKTGYDMLNQATLNITHFEDTNIKGTVTAYESGLLFTSIPYEKGWSVKVNGKKAEINPKSEAEINNVDFDNSENQDVRQISNITDGFITVMLDEGTHEIEFTYVTDGFIPGVLITILSVLIIICWEMYVKYYKKVRKTSNNRDGNNDMNMTKISGDAHNKAEIKIISTDFAEQTDNNINSTGNAENTKNTENTENNSFEDTGVIDDEINANNSENNAMYSNDVITTEEENTTDIEDIKDNIDDIDNIENTDKSGNNDKTKKSGNSEKSEKSGKIEDETDYEEDYDDNDRAASEEDLLRAINEKRIKE